MQGVLYSVNIGRCRVYFTVQYRILTYAEILYCLGSCYVQTVNNRIRITRSECCNFCILSGPGVYTGYFSSASYCKVHPIAWCMKCSMLSGVKYCKP